MTVSALRRGQPPQEEISRLIECTRCHDHVRVYEIPRRFIEERNYVCGQCVTKTEERAA